MIKRIPLAVVCAGTVAAAVLPATAGAATCPPGTTAHGDYCENAAGRTLPTVVYKVRPGRARFNPRSFTTTGTVSYPKSLDNATACSGFVAIIYKADTSAISSRRVRVHRSDGACRFESEVTFSAPRRFGGQRTLSVHVRFQGNKVLLPRDAKTGSVEVR